MRTWLLCLCVPPAFLGQEAHVRTPVSTDAKIEFYSHKLTANPRLYPVYVQLAAAYLDKTRETHDSTYLPKAREAVQKSLDIQQTLEAFQMMAAICNYSHRFEDAIEWGKRAAESTPHDTSIIAALVESYLGLGQITEAERLLATLPASLEDFYSSASRGHVLKAKGQFDEAAASFLKAGEFAKNGKATALAVWACVQAAGVWLDSGQPDRAAPLLESAAALDPTDRELKIHQAEFSEATGKTWDALRIYEKILASSNDAEVHSQAFRLAKRLGEAEQAQKHFEAAERMYQRAIDAGEVYTLAALARLYQEAEVHLDRALELSKRSLEYQRDALTRKTCEAIELKCKDKRSGSP